MNLLLYLKHYIIKNNIFCIIFLSYFYSINSFSKITDQQQETNIRKAQTAFENEKYFEAEKLLLINKKEGHYYLPTMSLLSDLYNLIGQYKKSLELKYEIISNEHTNQILKYPSNLPIENLLKKIQRPKDEILDIYKSIADIYSTIIEKKNYPKNFNEILIKQSVKYFKVLIFYNYLQVEINFNLAVIQYNRGEYEKTIALLKKDLKFYFKRKKSLQDDDQLNLLDQIYYYLGSSYLQLGFSSQGEIYLNKVAQREKSSADIKLSANEFLNYLKEDSFGFNFSYGLNYSNNLHNLNDSDLSSFQEFYQDTYGEKSGTMKNVSLSTNITKKIFNNYMLDLYGSYDQSHSIKNITRIANSKTTSFGANVSFHNLRFFLFDFSFDHLSNYTRADISESLSLYNSTDTMTFNVSHLFLSSVLKYSIPYSISKYRDFDTKSTSLSLNLSYQPYSVSRFINPGYYFSFGKQDELSGDPSTLLNFVLSDDIHLSTSSFYLSFSIIKNLNTDSSVAFFEISPSISWNYNIDFIPILNFAINSQLTRRSYSDGEQNNSLSLGTTVSVNL